MKVRKLTLMGLLCAIALTIFMVEAQIPAPVPLPGVKLGLSNIITVFAGNFSTILYSGAGGLCAILVTIALRRILNQKQLWVASCAGAIAHSIGQMVVAVLVTGTPAIAIYLPALILCSIITGVFTGLCAQVLVNRGKDIWKTFFK